MEGTNEWAVSQEDIETCRSFCPLSPATALAGIPDMEPVSGFG